MVPARKQAPPPRKSRLGGYAGSCGGIFRSSSSLPALPLRDSCHMGNGCYLGYYAHFVLLAKNPNLTVQNRAPILIFAGRIFFVWRLLGGLFDLRGLQNPPQKCVGGPQRSHRLRLRGGASQRHFPDTLPRDTSRRRLPETLTGYASQRRLPEALPRDTYRIRFPEALPRDTYRRRFPETLTGDASQRHLPDTLTGCTYRRRFPEALPGGASQRHFPEALPGDAYGGNNHRHKIRRE